MTLPFQEVLRFTLHPCEQVLPFASEETLTTLEGNIADFGAVSERLQSGLTARQITSQLLGSLEAPEEGFTLTPRCAQPYRGFSYDDVM